MTASVNHSMQRTATRFGVRQSAFAGSGIVSVFAVLFQVPGR